MADNYLERKMEEHRQTPRRQHPVRLSPAGNRPGKLTVDYPPRRVYVTGGARGIGAAIVRAFCDAGCRVAFCDCDSRAGALTAQRCGAQFHPLDVTDTQALTASLQRVADTWGGIDVVVNNVGVGGFKPLVDSTLDDFRRILEVNLMPVWVTAHAMARQGYVDGQGRVINICSTRYMMSEAGTEGYTASKGAIASLTHALMASLAPLGVTVNCVSPGWIHVRDDEALRDIDHRFHPSGRVGVPEDVARMCLYLASPAAQFVNGQNIVVDGGVTRRMIYPPD